MKRPPAAALAFVMALAPTARAQAPTNPASASTRLDYQRAPGAETCPDADAWRDAVVSKIEGAADPFNATGPNVLRVTMERRATDYRATFQVIDAAGSSRGAQEQTAATCADAARALAVSASLLFVARPAPHQPSAAPLPPPSTFPPSSSPSPSPLPPPGMPPPHAHPQGRRWRVQLGAGAGATAGFSPSIAPSFAGFVGLRFPLTPGEDGPAFAISIEGRGDLEGAGSRVDGPGDQTAQVRTSFAGGTVAPCLHGGRWFLGCILLTSGRVRAALGDDTAPGAQDAPFVGFGGRAAFELPLVRGSFLLAVRVALDGWFSIVRPEVRIEGAPIWTAPQGAGALGGYVVTLF